MQIQLHLRVKREACNLTQAAVGKEVHHSESFISRLENAIQWPTLPMLGSLGRLYVCHPFDLVTYVNFPLPRILSTAVCAACGATREASSPAS